MLKWFKRRRKLDEEMFSIIKSLCDEGDVLAGEGDFSAAIRKYWEAWDLLPEPQTEWEAATWILAAIANANFLLGDYVACKENLATAMNCPGAVGNAFLHLRLGQCHFQLIELDQAADELMRAYMAGGKEIFSEDDPRYFEFLTTRAKEPPGGW